MHPESNNNKRPIAQLRLRRFFGLFWPIFDSFCGGSIRSLIQPPQNESKTRLKRTQKSTEAKLRKRSILLNTTATHRYELLNDAFVQRHRQPFLLESHIPKNNHP